MESIWQKQGIYEAHGGEVLDLSCTKEYAPRAARVYQTLIQNLTKRGFTIRVDSGRSGGTFIECYDESVKISMREKLKKILYKRPKGQAPSIFGDPKFVFIPSGKLTLRIDEYSDSHKHNVDEDDHPLELQLNDFMVRLAKAALHLKWKRAEYEQRQQKWAKEQQAEERARQRMALEKKRREDLDKLTANWVKAKHIRAFIETIRTTPMHIPYDDDMNKEQWLNWAVEYANELDPLTT